MRLDSWDSASVNGGSSLLLRVAAAAAFLSLRTDGVNGSEGEEAVAAASEVSSGAEEEKP